MTEPLLSVRDLAVSFATDGGALRALDGVSLDVQKGKSVALVGESGSGKSVTALAIMRLLASPPARVVRGAIHFEGRDLLRLTEREMREVRGARIGMVFQDPMTALDPVYSVGFHVAEAIRLHQRLSRAETQRRVIAGLERVGFPRPRERLDNYPHELSGGMRQRVLIAMALACSPSLLIADEPTTALDVTIQAQILELLRELRAELGMGLLLVAHDLGVVGSIADEIVVLYAGVVVERGPTASILRSPAHPYTRALLESIPPTGDRAHRVRGQRGRSLPTIEGTLPDLRSPPTGCRFQARCPEVMDRCRTEPVPLFEDGNSAVRCLLAKSERGAA